MSTKQKRRVGGVEYEGSTPLDDTLKIALDADKEITQLKALNAELLAALEWVSTHAYAGGKQFKDVEPIKSALAKARN